ncbi:SRPBCC family protein [Spirillospora sp. NPDC029432]|uniref:SRPBCC family protein n=1 Tax=Spirillospora sp. NPDC029432 TaxID=3154599 RepID=UPI00345516E8
MSGIAVHADAESAAPADEVFAVLTDWPRHAEWMPFTEARGGHGVGAELEGWTGVGPLGFTDTMVITGWRPGRRVTVRHTGRLVRGEAFFDVAPLPGGGSRIRWAERLDLPLGPLGRAGWIAAGPAFRAFMALGLRRLARLAEADGTVVPLR